MKLIVFIKTHIKSFYINVVSSIAFYPTLISLALLFLAFLLLSIEDEKLTNYLLENASYLVINNADTARSILSTLIGGIISLTVFSFSMVMVLLNQASSNFSPRLLPGLISDRSNQVVLGVYIGTIIYNIIVLMSVIPTDDAYTIQGFSILVGIILGIICLAFFVFFIHSISSGIQINNILHNIYKQSKGSLESQIDIEKNDRSNTEVIDHYEHKVVSDRTGYFQGTNLDSLLDFATDKALNILIVPFKGRYILPGETLYRVDKPIDDESAETLLSMVIYAQERGASDNYVVGIKQMVEVGIKAMSPGINDPGTALVTLDYLTDLLAQRMLISDSELHHRDDIDSTVVQTIVTFKETISHSLVSYRQYCKHDVLMMEKIVRMLKYLMTRPTIREEYKAILEKELETVKMDIRDSINNDADRELLLNI